MTATPTRWVIYCDRANYACQTPPVTVDVEALAEARRRIRDRRWHSGPWRQWSRLAHLDLCPACVAYVQRRLQETADLAQIIGRNSSTP